jgi:uncharacterized protein
MLNTTRSDGKIALKILEESPLDQEGCKIEVADAGPTVEHWLPSRYNIHAAVDDGRLILWNTLSNAMSVFTKDQVPHVLALIKGRKGFEGRSTGLVGYLAKRGFLVRKGADEYRQFRLKFGQQHFRNDRLALILMSSEDCNFRCKYCYEDFARGTMQPGVRKGIKRFVEEQIENLRTLGISWFGGEPLYGWAAIEDLAPFFIDLTEKHGVGYASHMTTNGYLLNSEVADKLLAWKINDFQITLDGAPETHDCNRPGRDGSGTFWTIFENLKGLARRRDEFYVGIRVNFDETNKDRLPEFLDLAEKEFRNDPRFQVNFQPIGRWGGSNDDVLKPCDENEQNRVITELKAEAYRRGLHFSTIRNLNRLGGRVCYAARPNNLLIGASGQVMKCTVVLDKEDHNVVGRISEDGELTLDRDRFALWTEPAFERDQQCQRCVVLPSCQGISCPLPRIRREVRPCISSRREAKAELVEALKYPFREINKRQI